MTIKEWRNRATELQNELDQVSKEREGREQDRRALSVDALALKDAKAAEQHASISGEVIELIQREQSLREAIEGVESRIVEIEEQAERDRIAELEKQLRALCKKELKEFERIEELAAKLKAAMGAADETALAMQECTAGLDLSALPVTQSRRYIGEFLAWKLGTLPDRAHAQNRRPITENGYLWLEQWVPEFKGKAVPHRWGFEVTNEENAQAV